MQRSDTEISQWSEIFCNEKYKEIPSLKGIIADQKEVIEKILSIRIPIEKNLFPDQKIEQYNIETKKYITNLTTHNGLDFHISQYNKYTKKRDIHSPYSDPGYSIYAVLLCAYYEVFNKRPILNFPDTDIVRWNNQLKQDDLPFESEMRNTQRDVHSYIHAHDLFQQDSQWIHRIILPTEDSEWRTEPGFGIQWNDIILQCVDNFYRKGTRHQFFMEKELINLYLQAFIDVNREHAWSLALNLKKIADVLYKVLEDPQLRQEEYIGTKLRNESLKAE